MYYNGLVDTIGLSYSKCVSALCFYLGSHTDFFASEPQVVKLQQYSDLI